MRDCDVDLKAKNKYGRAGKDAIKPKRMKQPKLGGYTVTSTKTTTVKTTTQLSLTDMVQMLYDKDKNERRPSRQICRNCKARECGTEEEIRHRMC